MAKRILLASCLLAALMSQANAQTTAACELMVNPALDPADQEPLAGTLTLTQNDVAGSITITGTITGFDQTDPDTKHGFHVHQTGDFSDGCDSTGGHFNPFGQNHGAPEATERHAGDLGNIEEVNGDCVVDITDDVIDFSGANDITGKAIVIHAWEDDLGLTNHTDSPTTGNAGPRLACCAIEIVNGSGKHLPIAENVMILVAVVVSLIKVL